MNDAWDVTQQGQNNVYPEMQSDSDLQKNAEGREQNGKDNS